MSAELRAMKARQVRDSVRQSGTFRADQGAIWDKIGEKSRRMRAASPTMAMSNIYEKARPSLREYLSHFRPVDMQIGAVLMINEQVVGLDGFAKPHTFSKVFNKLLESYALDAVDWLEPKKEYTFRRGPVTAFLKSALSASVESRPSVALGRDWRLSSSKLAGFALVLDDQVLHLSMFSGNGDEGKRPRHHSRMQPLSARRRNRS